MNHQQTNAPAVLVIQGAELKDLLESTLNSFKEEMKELFERYQDPEKDNDLLTSQDLCDLLQTTRSQLWKWTQRGLLNPIRFEEKGKIFYRKSEVFESLKGTRTMRKLSRGGSKCQ